MKIASNENVSLFCSVSLSLGCCKISARLGTLFIGCVGAIAHLFWMLITILLQKTSIFKATSEQSTGFYTEQIFGTLIAFSVVGALLGVLLIISVIGQKGVRIENIGLSLDPDHCYLTPDHLHPPIPCLGREDSLLE